MRRALWDGVSGEFSRGRAEFDGVRWNLMRYYRRVWGVDSLKRLGGFAACLMKNKMTKSERRFGASMMGGAALRVCAIAALFGVLAGPMEAADATHTRVRHGVQSAGAVETRGRIRETASARRNERELVAEKPRAGRRGSRSVAAKEPGARESVGRSRSRVVESRAVEERVVRGRGRKQRAVVVEEPVVVSRASMSRASRRRGVSRVVRETAEVKKPETSSTKDEGSQRVATVEDFLRAAKAPAPAADAEATGVSRPDEGERIEAEVNAAVEKPVVAAPSVMAGAKKGIPVVTADDAPPAPTKHVVEGFGGEVAVTQSPALVTRAVKKSAPPVDDWSRDDAATRQAITDDVMKPVMVPLYSRSGKLMTPAPLKGSREVLVHQNTMADQEGLSRIQDDADLDRMLEAHLLMRIPETDALYVNEELPMNRRAARPWTVKFVSDLSRSYYAKFHDPLRLSSAVRTVDFQLRLQRVNGNAAAVEGETASPHLTGQAIDFGKSGMSRVEIAWMRAYLLPLMQAGKIDVEEEFQQSCFHISVYASYAPKRKATRMEVAEVK